MTNIITIFLAEDDSDDRALFSESLKAAAPNSQLALFENGEQLLHFLRVSQQKPDLIFLDLKMPGLDGKQCLKQIREDLSLRDTAVVIFTCTEYIEDIRETYKYGANLYVPKHVFVKDSIPSLKLIVGSVLDRSILDPTRKSYVLGRTISPFSWYFGKSSAD